MPRKKVIVKEANQDRLFAEATEAGVTGEKIFSVGPYLDLLNEGLKTFEAKVRGEVSSVDERGGHMYFALKDKEDNSVINCVIWKYNYQNCGMKLEVGIEIAAFGKPNIYKPYGKLTFIADSIELLGEGALKKQYDELKKKLELEGLFAPERKQVLPLFPEKIGVITSRNGAVINDFLNNVGRFGFKIKLIDSRVEGAQAVTDLREAIAQFKKMDIDVLVIIRGGGSLESMLAFNNEALVRDIIDFPVPVLAGIGHDKDVPLLALAADRMCSTPTAVAALLNYTWEQAKSRTDLFETNILTRYREGLFLERERLSGLSVSLQNNFSDLLQYLNRTFESVGQLYARLVGRLETEKNNLATLATQLPSGFAGLLGRVNESLSRDERSLAAFDPARQLALGYSIVRSGGRVLKSVKSVKMGDELEIKLADGTVLSEAKEINK